MYINKSAASKLNLQYMCLFFSSWVHIVLFFYRNDQPAHPKFTSKIWPNPNLYYTKRSRNWQLTKMTNLCRPRIRHRRRNGTQQAHFESFALGGLWTGDEGNCVYSGSIISTSSSSSSSLSFAWWHRSTLKNAQTFILKRKKISPHEVLKLHDDIVTVCCKMWQPKSEVDR